MVPCGRSKPYPTRPSLWWTNECYQALDSAGRARVDTLITGTGVETVLLQS